MLRVIGVVLCLAMSVASGLLSLVWAGHSDPVGVACCVVAGFGCVGWAALAAGIAVGLMTDKTDATS